MQRISSASAKLANMTKTATTGQAMKSKLHLQATAQTDIGRRSDHNEDAIFFEVSEQATAALLIVADGMGGHLAGEQASQLTIDTVAESMRDWLSREEIALSEQISDAIEKALYTAVQKANQTVYSYAQEELGYGANMGSTIVCALVHQGIAYVANVGDSRAYVYRQQRLYRITEDHSLVERFVQEGIISEEARYTHEVRHVVTRAIGPKTAVGIDLFALDLEAGDILLLCSDGLWEMLRGDEHIVHYLQQSSDLTTLSQNLINAANDAGGEDNISVVLAQLLATK